MNLTISGRPKTTKQSFIQQDTTPAPLALPLQSPPKQPNTHNNCGSLFFVNCLNVNPTEPNQQQIQAYKDVSPNQPSKTTPRSPPINNEEGKRKISLSITQKTSQQNLIPKKNEPIKWPSSLEVSPIQLKPKGQGSGIKQPNSTSPSQIKNQRVQELDVSKNSQTFLSLSFGANHYHKIQDSPIQEVSFNIAPAEGIKEESDRFRLFPSAPKQQLKTNPVDPIINSQENGKNLEQQPRPSIVSQEEADFNPGVNFRVKDRRWIGDYAKTIKTINQTENRENQSEIESVVIQRGHHFNHNVAAVTPVNRGSIKDYSLEEATLGRGYGSVGEELHKARLAHFGSINQTIEEVLHDSDI